MVSTGVGRHRKQGKAFEHEWWLGMQLHKRQVGGSVRIHRFYDLSDYVGKRCPVCKQHLDVCGRCHSPLPQSKAQPPKQPSDYETVSRGISILHECKSSRNPVSFEMRFIKPHQLSYLLNNIQAGGEGVFVLQDRSKARHFKVYCVAADDLLKISTETGKQSIRWEMIEKVSFHIPDRKKDDTSGDMYYDHGDFLESLFRRRLGEGVRLVWGSLKAEMDKVKEDPHHIPTRGISGIFID